LIKKKFFVFCRRIFLRNEIFKGIAIKHEIRSILARSSRIGVIIDDEDIFVKWSRWNFKDILFVWSIRSFSISCFTV